MNLMEIDVDVVSMVLYSEHASWAHLWGGISVFRHWFDNSQLVWVIENFSFDVKEGEEFLADSSIVDEWFACLWLSGGAAA